MPTNQPTIQFIHLAICRPFTTRNGSRKSSQTKYALLSFFSEFFFVRPFLSKATTIIILLPSHLSAFLPHSLLKYNFLLLLLSIPFHVTIAFAVQFPRFLLVCLMFVPSIFAFFPPQKFFLCRFCKVGNLALLINGNPPFYPLPIPLSPPLAGCVIRSSNPFIKLFITPPVTPLVPNRRLLGSCLISLPIPPLDFQISLANFLLADRCVCVLCNKMQNQRER